MSILSFSRRKILGSALTTPLAGLSLEAAGQQPAASSGVYNALLFPEPPTLILSLDQNTPTQVAAGKIYESLLTYDHDFTPRPSLAKSWTISPDGLIYTFKLQENVKWHDGKPFTADDVVFTTKEMLMQVHARAKAIYENCKTIEALDKFTVRFTLKTVFAPFIMAFEVSTSPMMPAHIYRGTDYRTNPNNTKPVGTGPFKLVEWKRGAYIHLTRNPDYYVDGQPYLNDVFFHIIPDAASRTLALEQGRVHEATSNHFEAFDVKRLMALNTLNATGKGFEFTAPVVRIEFNTRVKPFDDKRFRQAINYALDRNFISTAIFSGLAKPATGPLSSPTRFYEADVGAYTLNEAKARALLDEMGLKPDGAGIRARVTLLRLPVGETYDRLAEYIKQSLRKVGIDVTLESADFATWTTRYGNWDFQMTFTAPNQLGDPALGMTRFFVSSNIRKGVAFSNCTGYSNEKVDALFAKGASTIVASERQAAYRDIQKQLVEDAPMAWLVEAQRYALISKQYTDCIVSAIGVCETYRRARKAA
jgi:peptide/nickel transport system substrate-binding protein